MPTQRKIDSVNDLTEKISRAKSVVLADYRGLKHKQLEELRKILKKTNAEFVVTKNRLLLKALGHQSEKLRDKLEDTTAVLFSYADEAAPLKDLLKFFKTANFGKTKAGLLGSQVLSDNDITRLATLPNKNVMLAQLVGQLNAPIQGLHRALSWNILQLVYALEAVKNKK